MTVRHADGLVIEYVQFKNSLDIVLKGLAFIPMRTAPVIYTCLSVAAMQEPDSLAIRLASTR